MRIYDIAFYGAGFFLVGVFFRSLRLNFLTIILTAALFAVFLIFLVYLKKSGSFKATAPDNFFWLAGLASLIVFGGAYFAWYEWRQIKNVNMVFDAPINFSGIVAGDPERGNAQRLIIKVQPPYSGRLFINMKPHPVFQYGDLINFKGVIKKPEPASYARYLVKDRIFGAVNFPEAELISGDNGWLIKAVLLKFKEEMISNFQKILPPEKAAFLGGITLGERAEFSKEFKEAMSASGTTHLVALSGYNIAILSVAVFNIFNFLFSRRLRFYLTTVLIVSFVAMTGAEASVVRAAIMGFILMLASRVNRLYSLRNAIVVAAFLMIILNPLILMFDIGFQLSFLALLGIVCLGPAIRKFFRLREEEGFLGWRENFLAATSAQLAVAPFLIINFGQFSPLSLLANVLILEAIPPTMFLGFLVGFLGFLSYYFSLIVGWLVGLFLAYELFIINLFGATRVLEIHSAGLISVVGYYIFLIGFVLYNKNTGSFKATEV